MNRGDVILVRFPHPSGTVAKVLGSLSAGLKQRLNDCLKAALGLP